MNIFGQLKLNKLESIELSYDSPFELFQKIYKNYPDSFLLESMESDSGLARSSFLGFEPVANLKAYGNILEIEIDGNKEEIETSNPFIELKSLINMQNENERFSGGLVGYVSYEAVQYFEKIELQKYSGPYFEFGLFLDGIIFDKINNKCKYVTVGDDRLEEIKKIEKEEFKKDNLRFKTNGQHFSKNKFEKMVSEAKEDINNGEIFQSVISNAFKYKIRGNKLNFYEKLREMNPSPYMYHLKLGEHEIIGSSPEMLVRVENRNIETFPIAGTRRRGADTDEDKLLEKELLNDEKERAEHLMLVDLARNDIGRVSDFGTVDVPEYMNVKKFSHVQHIVTKVTGKLQNNKTSVDALASVFPAGTVSGAPKIRAMEIINELENIPRGPYAGAIGYFSLNGNSNFAITIRSLVCDGENAKIQAGAGIVHDSVPENEYYECESKAMALVSALKRAGESK